ncbi:MAG: bifunctional pyr operon transcriptional regulator/uracil phosphoribosyltransferase PyrR [Desulfobacteraceae bacterium]|nr:bifunctional pyr operon transcriptional regulator/uracil phosphoribosyltransferase PyrR [Desulfobacteraceae bacterium]
MKKSVILKEEDISAKIQKMAKEILEKNRSVDDIVLVGIRTGGAFLAERLQAAISSLGVSPPPLGILDITLYRDDWTKIAPTPIVGKTELPFSISDRVVVLVDDVLYTGRTVRAAMDALMDYGRPRRIELAILVDRGDVFRELPISSNYVGWVWGTAPEETINVYLKEAGSHDHVAIEEKKAA